MCLQSQLLNFALQGYNLFLNCANEKCQILINSTFCVWEFFGSSLVRLWFFLGLLYVGEI